MAVTTLRGIDAVRSALGTHLGYSDWLEITQDRVDVFADATGDHQWIHVNVDKAKTDRSGRLSLTAISQCLSLICFCPRSSR